VIADLIIDGQRNGRPAGTSDALVQAMTAAGVHVRTGRLAYVLEGDLDAVFAAARAAADHLRRDGVERALVELRLVVEGDTPEATNVLGPGYRSIGEHAD
jgi:hypothetical protein